MTGTRHGWSGTRTYRSWQQMRDRCNNARHHAFASYGGRGITVCERWASFEAFLADMGERPVGLSLERIDNDRGYTPDNCRWATRLEQSRNQRTNRRIAFRGETLTLAEWAARIGVTPTALYFRLRKGWPVERALTAPRDDEMARRASR